MCTDATLSFSTPLGSNSAVPQFHTCATFASGQLAIFGVGVTAVLSAEIVLAVPYNAAPQLQNTAAVAGKVVVVQRGGSTFQEKATQAQVAGAVGVIIVNNVADDPSRLVVMNITATVGIAIKIPVVMVSQSAEAALQASQGLRITIRPTPQSPVGNSGPLRLWRASALTAGRLTRAACCACICRSIADAADCRANPEHVHALQWASSRSGLERQEQRQLQHVQLPKRVSGMHHDGVLHRHTGANSDRSDR